MLERECAAATEAVPALGRRLRAGAQAEGGARAYRAWGRLLRSEGREAGPSTRSRKAADLAARRPSDARAESVTVERALRPRRDLLAAADRHFP